MTSQSQNIHLYLCHIFWPITNITQRNPLCMKRKMSINIKYISPHSYFHLSKTCLHKYEWRNISMYQWKYEWGDMYLIFFDFFLFMHNIFLWVILVIRYKWINIKYYLIFNYIIYLEYCCNQGQVYFTVRFVGISLS